VAAVVPAVAGAGLAGSVVEVFGGEAAGAGTGRGITHEMGSQSSTTEHGVLRSVTTWKTAESTALGTAFVGG
jgi:hypothetical protein